jgi:hypothetical protein
VHTLVELDQFLEVDHKANYWSDDAVVYAATLADSLSDPEWASLEKIWPERRIHWQVRLADAVYGSDKPRVVDLLIQMLQSPEISVAIAALDSLEAKDYTWTPSAALRSILEKLLSCANGSNRPFSHRSAVEKLLSLIQN